MNIFELISLLSFFIYVYLGIVVYLRQTENPINRVFFIYSLLAVYMCFTDFQMRMSSSFEQAHFWWRVGVLWHLMLPALVHFVFVFTMSERKRFGHMVVPLYAVGLLFAWLDYFGNRVVAGPRPSPWGWSYGALQQTLVGNLNAVWSTSLIIVGIVLCLRHYLRVTDAREKQQAKYVLIGTSVPMLAGIAEIIFSRLPVEIPNLILLSLVIGSGFWAYAIWKYELFVLSPVTSVKEILQTMSDALVLIDPERRIKEVNQASVALFEYERHELIDQPIALLFEDADYHQIFNGPIPGELARYGFFSDAEISIKSKTGRKIPVSLSGSLIRDKNKQFQGIAFVGRDIGKRKMEERELRRYQVHLEEIVAERTAELERTYAQLQRGQKMEFMGTIAGGVAHDLNNILSGIVSYPELLLLDLPEDSPLRKPIIAIHRSGEKAAAIVADLLSLARREVSVKIVINLNRVVNEYLQSPERAKMQSYHPDTEIVADLDPDLQNMTGSLIHLSKALMNLVHNGIEAMHHGGILSIRTENRRLSEGLSGFESIAQGTYVVLSVSDSGIGIAEADLEHIFEPFYTKKKMGQSGSGLGMAVVWATVKDHGGYIDLTSHEGRGTTVSLYFPASLRPEEAAPLRTPLERYRGRGERVLVVDDMSEQREIACSILRKLGYQAEAVSSGEAAIEYVKSTRADLVLLDMIMKPGIDGLETYRRILSLRPGQKAIIVSGFSENERVKEAAALGVGAFIRKPYSIEEIGLAIRRQLDERNDRL